MEEGSFEASSTSPEIAPSSYIHAAQIHRHLPRLIDPAMDTHPGENYVNTCLIISLLVLILLIASGRNVVLKQNLLA